MKTISALKCPTIDPARDTRQRIWVTSTMDTPNVELTGAARLYRAASSDQRERG